MGSRWYSAEQIITKLRAAEVLSSQGQKVDQIRRHLGICANTYYRWRRGCGGLEIDQARRLKQLEKENARLKKLGIPGKLLSPARRRRAVERIREVLVVSERHVCRLLGQARSSQRYKPRVREDEEALVRLRPEHRNHVWS